MSLKELSDSLGTTKEQPKKQESCDTHAQIKTIPAYKLMAIQFPDAFTDDINNHIEVAAISDSCQILSDTLNLVEKHIRPGQSVMELDKIAENYISSCDAKPAFKGYDGLSLIHI